VAAGIPANGSVGAALCVLVAPMPLGTLAVG